MIHGLCGLANKIAPCMRDCNCSKKYPKEFSSITTTANDGYPIYGRMDNSRSVEVGSCLLDNCLGSPLQSLLTFEVQCSYQCGDRYYC